MVSANFSSETLAEDFEPVVVENCESENQKNNN